MTNEEQRQHAIDRVFNGVPRMVQVLLENGEDGRMHYRVSAFFDGMFQNFMTTVPCTAHGPSVDIAIRSTLSAAREFVEAKLVGLDLPEGWITRPDGVVVRQDGSHGLGNPDGPIR